MRTRVPLALAAAACLAVPAIATASAPIRFTSVQVSQKQTKSGLIIRDDDFQGKTKIGHDKLVCTFTSNARATCIVRVSLANGTIRGHLTVGQNISAGPIAIIGGSGAFKGATGGGAFKNLNTQGTRTAVALHIK